MTIPRRRWTFSLPELLLGAAVVGAWVASDAWSSKESNEYSQGCVYPFGVRGTPEKFSEWHRDENGQDWGEGGTRHLPIGRDMDTVVHGDPYRPSL